MHIIRSLCPGVLLPVWHNNLPQYLSDLVERLQKRAFRIVLPNTTYSEALAQLKSMSLSERRDELCKKTIKKMVKGTCLPHLLPMTRVCAHGRDLRNGINRSSFSCRTNRFKNSFFPSILTFHSFFISFQFLIFLYNYFRICF